MFPKIRVTGYTGLFRCLLLGIVSLFTTQTVADIELSFGVYTTDQPTEMVKAYRPILSGMEIELSKRLEKKVKIALKVSSTYEKGVAALVQGDVDFSMLGAASYVSALDQNPSLRLLAIESNNDSKTFNGVISVSEDSSIESVGQLSGKSFAFGNEVSTIGRYLSQAYLIDNGIGADDLSRYNYLGRHDRVGHAVAAGKYDAGALKEGTFNKLVKKGLKIRSIATFPNVNKAWIASNQLSADLYLELQSVMLSMKDESLFEPFSRKRFVPGHKDDYDVIRDAIKNNNRFFTKIRSESTAELSEEE